MSEHEFAIADVLPGKLNALVKNIMRQTSTSDPNEAVRLVNSGEWVVKPVHFEFKVFKTIKLGTGIKDANGFRQAIKNAEMRIGDWSNDIIGKPEFTVATEETEVDLVNPTVAELGFKNGARREDIYARAMELGLGLCPAEACPQLRLQYRDQPIGEWLVIAMEPITDSDGYLGLFSVGHDDGGLWLCGDSGSPDNVWPASNRFVFCRRK